jgi:hypothetical protein
MYSVGGRAKVSELATPALQRTHETALRHMRMSPISLPASVTGAREVTLNTSCHMQPRLLLPEHILDVTMRLARTPFS